MPVAGGFRQFPSQVRRSLLTKVSGREVDAVQDKLEGKIVKEFINTILSRAGKGKDELIQILGKEIGFALAAVLAEPLQKLVENKKLTISIELTNKKETTTRKKATLKKRTRKTTKR